MAITVFVVNCEYCGATRSECRDRDPSNCPNLYVRKDRGKEEPITRGKEFDPGHCERCEHKNCDICRDTYEWDAEHGIGKREVTRGFSLYSQWRAGQKLLKLMGSVKDGDDGAEDTTIR